jgi:hypothetical protein
LTTLLFKDLAEPLLTLALYLFALLPSPPQKFHSALRMYPFGTIRTTHHLRGQVSLAPSHCTARDHK